MSTKFKHSGFAYRIGVDCYDCVFVLRSFSQPQETDTIKFEKVYAVRAFRFLSSISPFRIAKGEKRKKNGSSLCNFWNHLCNFFLQMLEYDQ